MQRAARLLMFAALAMLWGASVCAGQEKAAWYKPPQLFVMTGFIANSTSGTWGAHFLTSAEWTVAKQRSALAEWNKGLDRHYNADRTILAFKEAGATGVIFCDKWHDGLVGHDTKLTRWKTERDLLGETIKALRKHNLKIIVYYSVGLDYNPEPRFLEWACRDANGNPMGRAFPTDFMSFHSPYRRFVIDHLVEIVTNYRRWDTSRRSGSTLDGIGQGDKGAARITGRTGGSVTLLSRKFPLRWFFCGSKIAPKRQGFEFLHQIALVAFGMELVKVAASQFFGGEVLLEHA